jgi:hypothetical protein
VRVFTLNEILRKALILIFTGLVMMILAVIVFELFRWINLKDIELGFALLIGLGMLGFVALIIGLLTLDDYIDIYRAPIQSS